MCNNLCFKPNAELVNKKLRIQHPEVNDMVYKKIKKLLEAWLIQPINYPTWLANVVLMMRKNGTISVCINFCDLNTASLK